MHFLPMQKAVHIWPVNASILPCAVLQFSHVLPQQLPVSKIVLQASQYWCFSYLFFGLLPPTYGGKWWHDMLKRRLHWNRMHPDTPNARRYNKDPKWCILPQSHGSLSHSYHFGVWDSRFFEHLFLVGIVPLQILNRSVCLSRHVCIHGRTHTVFTFAREIWNALWY